MSKDRSAVNALDQAFLSIFDDMLSNIVRVSEDAANEILDMSSSISSESTQSTLHSFQALYQSDHQMNQIKYQYNCEIDDLIEQVNQGVELPIGETSTYQMAGEHLAQIQKNLEATIQIDKELRAELAPIIVGMQFAETTSQHLTGVSTAWQCIVDQLNTQGNTDGESVLQNIKNSLRTRVEIDAFYNKVLKTSPPETDSDSNLTDWIDALFEEGVA
ncbi:MAG: hypothetical protein V3V12_01505 [Gammaproteobacteria bacterium]